MKPSDVVGETPDLEGKDKTNLKRSFLNRFKIFIAENEKLYIVPYFEILGGFLVEVMSIE